MGKSAVSPTIDGKLDDAAWQQSVAISDFTLTGTRNSAAEPTQVKLVYDNQNLYVAWRSEESLLTVAQQRMHEVKTKAKELDSDVLSDDSVLLFVQPKTDGVVYEFNLNSIGTLFDARSERDSLWESRDASWNSGAVASARQEDGFWTAELAISWKTFGLNTPPVAESVWEIGFARRAAGRDESSAWHQSSSSALHIVDHFGKLVFGDRVPGLTRQPLSSFEAGQSTLVVQLAPSVTTTENIEIAATITEDNKVQNFQQSHTTTNKSVEIKLPLTAKSESPLLQWSARSTDGKVLYSSPRLQIPAQSTLTRLSISTEKPWKLFVNGKQVGAGNSAQNQEIAFPLISGANDIIVKVEEGAAQLALIVPGISPSEEIAWRTTAASNTKALEIPDRSKWQIAPQKTGVIGNSGAPAFLQHTLLWESTPYYPRTDPALYIAEGTAQQITFIAEGVKDIPFTDWQMTIAVPTELEVVGSSGFYGNNIKGKEKFHTTKIGEKLLNGTNMMLYRVTADQPIRYQANKHLLLTTFEVLVRLAKNVKHDAAKEWQFHYWTRGNQNTISEVPQSFPVRSFPTLNGKQPKNLVWEFWSHATHVYDDSELLLNILDASRQAGFNKYQAASQKEFNDLVRSYGMKTFLLTGFRDGRTFDIVRPHLIDHPDERMIDKAGKPVADYMCTTQLLGENWPMFAKSIQDWMLKADLDAVEYDYEFPPFGIPHACFCERCLSEFRDFSVLSQDIDLNPAVVQEKYSPQWIDFMAYRAAILLGKMKEAVHEANPKVLFTAYSGYYNAKDNTTKSRYGIDWDLVGKMQAVDEAGMGYGRPVPSITDSITALRGIPVKFGELLVPYDMRSTRPVAPLKKATLLRRALDATAGVLIYKRNSMDGRSWTAIAETTRLVADYEDLFLAHKLAEIPGQDSANVQLLKGEKESLLCLMNETTKPQEFKFSLPKELGAGREYYSGQTVAAGSEVQITLSPGDAVVYVLQQ